MEELGGIEWNPLVAQQALTQAVSKCSNYGLKLATKWAAEQLVGIETEGVEGSDELVQETTPTKNNLSTENGAAAPTTPAGLANQIVFAKSLLDLGEYDRAAHILSVDGSPKEYLGGLGLFVRAYSLFLAGEKKKEEEMVELAEPLERSKVLNPNLEKLRSELSGSKELNQLDAFGLYMYGVVLKELLQQEAGSSLEEPPLSLLHMAKDVFVESILAFPYNWSAWLDLAEICIENTVIHDDVERALESLTDSWMYLFFLIHVFCEQQQNDQALQVIDRVSLLFPNSNYLKAQTALAYYNLRDFDRAQEQFLELCERDPFRLEMIDIFSNILYVKESKAELSALAQSVISVDKYRPEVCCIVGNYYSLKGNHGKAVQYFQRALKLNRKFLSAWTLMGHEFVEMRKTSAAIEAYRRAVDINARDYRAWYGLGQVYEILNMLLYALYYYRKAAALRPYDARMWCALGSCFLSLDRRQEAIKSYERAIVTNDRENIATRKLAKLYREEGENEKAARCYQRLVSGSGNEDALDAAEAEAFLFLAQYMKDSGNFDVATVYCSRLLEFPGPEKDEAKALLRDIRSRRIAIGS
ncbi:hypothetical protein TrVE_jg7936 [Triparma verrucosa]|uniref:Cdc23 domain-containing protein n=1 Tax=Triparma verrucosa TaxID=1606542 RepID=A0A9W7CIT4_9STRA|nr:hypothetical protein TrVE_jg7936 [Triparma verrucosa]